MKNESMIKTNQKKHTEKKTGEGGWVNKSEAKSDVNLKSR